MTVLRRREEKQGGTDFQKNPSKMKMKYIQ
jgi:hypothetical protein